jgi:hypothetical protein
VGRGPRVVAAERLDLRERLTGVSKLGVDEHIWRRPGRFGAGREVTCIVDPSGDEHGNVRARLLDLILGRSGPAYSRWIERPAHGVP